MNPCSCNASLQNLGVNSSKDLMAIARRLIFVPEFGDDGVKNDIATVTGVTKSALEALYNASNITKRFFPLPIMENVEDIRPDSIFQDFNSGIKNKVRDGIRHFVGYIPCGQGASSKLYGAIRANFECNRGGVYIVDRNGNFIYVTDKATGLKVQPILYEPGSANVILVKGTDKEVQMLKVEFDIRVSMDDALLNYICAENLNFDALVDPYALLNVNMVVSDVTTAGFTAKLTTDYGKPVRGLVKADFVLNDITTPGVISITDAVEGNPGEYAITATLSNSSTYQLMGSKSEFDFTPIESVAITTPIS